MGRGGLEIGPDGRLADDGKRLGLSESALDVAFPQVLEFYLNRGGSLREGWVPDWPGFGGWRISVWTLKSMKNSSVFVYFCYPEHAVTLFWSLEVSLEFQK